MTQIFSFVSFCTGQQIQRPSSWMGNWKCKKHGNDVCIPNLLRDRSCESANFLPILPCRFYGATFFEDNHNSLQNWDVSAVTSMKGMFSGATRFQGDLSLWDPAMVESFSSMFAYAASFDPAGGLNDWDVSNVKIMDRMFYRATKFEAELCWDTLAAGKCIK